MSRACNLPPVIDEDTGKTSYPRICPLCGATVMHNLRQNRNSAVRLRKPCFQCECVRRKTAYIGKANPFFGRKHNEQTLAAFKARDHPHVKEAWFKKLRSEHMRSHQPLRGTTLYERWVEKHGREKADELMASRREKKSQASSGANNPMFGRPAPQGSGNGWSGWYKGWFFRSLRELAYMVKVIERDGLAWRTAESSELKISYVDWRGASRTYTADFVIGEKTLVEIKPSKLHSSPTVMLKRAAALEFCERAGLEYRIVDPPPLSDGEIVELHDRGMIEFTERYEAKFAGRFKQCV